MYGRFRLFLSIKTFSRNISSTKIGETHLHELTTYLLTTVSYRHPTHSLIRFLIVSNSLDLILDIVLELWSAVAGTFLSLRFKSNILTRTREQSSVVCILCKKFSLL